MWPFGRSKLNRVLRNQEYLMSALSDLTDAVMAMSQSIDSAIVVLGSAPPDNSPQLVILKDELAAAKSRLDTAVAAVSSPVT
jgi:hypothetical protein